MANLQTVENIVIAFGLSLDHAFIIAETLRDNCNKPNDAQWAALRKNMNAVGFKATNEVFNAYNVARSRINCEEIRAMFADFQ